MKTLEVIEFAKSKAVITNNDISKKFNVDKSYASTFLGRLFKKGILKRIEKGKYTYIKDPTIVASNIVYPSYISFFSAASIKGYTEQIPKFIQVATTVYKKGINFAGNRVEFIKMPTWSFYGYSKEMKKEFTIFMVEDEKLIIDILLKPKSVGNFEEIVEITKNMRIKERKMREFASMVENPSVLRRLGYLLEKYKSIDLSDLVKIDRNYVNLNPFKKSGKNIDKKWRIKI